MVGCKKKTYQGVTYTEILVGNTAPTSGTYATYGLPFNDAIQAVFDYVNSQGGIGGRKIRFLNYNDEFTVEKGLAYTKRLVEEDKVFAIVGHFGTATVKATIDYLRDKGIPTVFTATGINDLYFEKSNKNPLFPIQPIYKVDGKVMAARAFKEHLYGPTKSERLSSSGKIGVIYTNDDIGRSIKEGIEEQFKTLKFNKVIYEQVSDKYTEVIDKFKTEGVVGVIISTNQAAFSGILTQMVESKLNVPIFSSYLNYDVTAIPDAIRNGTTNMDIYINAWIDIFSTEGVKDYEEFLKILDNANLSIEKKNQYKNNTFALAGYIAAKVFIEGLKRVIDSGLELTWENYISAMESAPITIPMGGMVDFTKGKRIGVDAMSLLKYTIKTQTISEQYMEVRKIESLQEILNK